jgi:hypothetical protein
LKSALQTFLDFCRDEKVPVIVAAGNKPFTTDVKGNLPQALSKSEDSMVMVGGVDEAGLVIPEMIADRDGLVHVYAPSENIEAPKDATQWETSSGTSQAAAIVVR